jgi:hypothetical protein
MRNNISNVKEEDLEWVEKIQLLPNSEWWPKILEQLADPFGDSFALRRVAAAAASIMPIHAAVNDTETLYFSEGSSASIIFEGLCRRGSGSDWWLRQREPLTEEWQIASWLMALALMPPEDVGTLGPHIEADLSTMSQIFTDRLIHAVYKDIELPGTSGDVLPVVGPRATCLLGAKFSVNRDRAWKQIVDKPELLRSAMALGSAACGEAIKRIRDANLEDIAFKDDRLLAFLEMLGPCYPVEDDLLSALHFTGGDRERLIADPYHWPQGVIIRAISDSPTVDEKRSLVAEVAKAKGWFSTDE